MSTLEFAKNLRAYMSANGLNASKLAHMIGTNESTVRAWISGKTMPTAYSLKLLSDATGVSADWWLS